jgi:hypothetical protein
LNATGRPHAAVVSGPAETTGARFATTIEKVVELVRPVASVAVSSPEYVPLPANVCCGLRPKATPPSEKSQRSVAALAEQEPLERRQLRVAADERGHRAGQRTSPRPGARPRHVLADDRPFERAELVAGLDAEIVAETARGAPVRGKRVGLALGAVQGEHQEPPQALAIGMVDEQPLELVHVLAGRAQREAGFDAILQGRQMELCQALGRRAEVAVVGDRCERGTRPELERLVQSIGGSSEVLPGERVTALADEALEASDVD